MKLVLVSLFNFQTELIVFNLLENILITNQLVRVISNTRQMFTETGKRAGFVIAS